jgi:hypothetical protein
MRYIFGLLGLVIVLAVISTLSKKQLSVVNPIQLPPGTGITVDPNASVKAQSEQIQQQVKQSLEQAVKARPEGDEK